MLVIDPAPIKPAVSQGKVWDITLHLTVMSGALRSCLMAYVCIYFLFDGETGPNAYPAFRPNLRFELAWMLPILVRNMLLAWTICGFWDWFLYFSPWSKQIRKHKFTQALPTNQQFIHDAFNTSLATICGSGLEVLMCYGWSNDILPLHLAHIDWVTVAAGVLLLHWRVNHFYLVHRMMHPWKTTWVPDVGRFMYRHFHSLHHKSYNPTAFSGTSMHPVEATIYYSAALMPVALGIHPGVAVATIIDCGVAAWIGHDGFADPSTGDYFHYLHHSCFDGNYGVGDPFLPLDRWCGTLLTCKEDIKKVWGNRKAGWEGNETAVHSS
jgi:sterol desaturase/sphingolipid hydroxylase (fatty acid hydroxylase superfamily)